MTNFDIAKAILSDFPSSSNDGCWYSTSVHIDEVDAIRALDDDSEMTKALKELIQELEDAPNDSGCWYYDTFYAENVEKCRDLVKNQK